MDEYMQRLQAVARSGRGGGGFPGGKPPPGAAFALTGAVALLAGGWLLSNALFNVDGGHRAIKYRRISGVSKEIYNEGESGSPGGPRARNMVANAVVKRNALYGPMV
jgi:prohibitin 2